MSYRTLPRRDKWLGHAGLAVIALYAITRGIAYLPAFAPAELPDALLVLTALTGFTPWAVAWLIAGALCVVGIIRQDRVWSAGVAGMSIAWGAAYGINWVRSLFNGNMDVSRDWLTCGTYLAPGLLIAIWIAWRNRVVTHKEH